MERRKIKNTDLVVSPLVMGGCPLGGHGWGAVERDSLVGAVQAALDGGVNFFDTSDTYGLGESERVLKDALGARRHDVVIATKFGVVVGGGKTVYVNTRAHAISALEGSLKRLGRDCIDLFLVHHRDGVTPLEDIAETMEILKSQGKIKYAGLSNAHESDLAELRAMGSHPFRVVQNEYSLATRKFENELKTFRDEMGITPMTWGSLGQGILTGKYGKDVKFDANDRRSRAIYENFHGEKLQRNLAIVEEMKAIAAAHGKPMSALAVRWILDHLDGSVVIVGAKSPEQARQNAEAMGWSLTPDEIQKLKIISGGNL